MDQDDCDMKQEMPGLEKDNCETQIFEALVLVYCGVSLEDFFLLAGVQTEKNYDNE